MSVRTTLPSNLTGASLSRSGEGVTFQPRTASIPASTSAARTLSPSRATMTAVPQTDGGKVSTESEGYGFNFDSMTIIWLVVIPIVVWIILFTWKPNFVTDLVSGERVINTSKLLLWTVIISVVLWVLLWLAMTAYKRRQ